MTINIYMRKSKYILVFFVSLVCSYRLNAQINIGKTDITLDLYSHTHMIDSVIERGKYMLFIRHDKDIIHLGLWKNNRKIRRVNLEEISNALYKGLQSRLLRPMFTFKPGTNYDIRVQLEGEESERIYNLTTPVHTKSRLLEK